MLLKHKNTFVHYVHVCFLLTYFFVFAFGQSLQNLSIISDPLINIRRTILDKEKIMLEFISKMMLTDDVGFTRDTLVTFLDTRVLVPVTSSVYFLDIYL